MNIWPANAVHGVVRGGGERGRPWNKINILGLQSSRAEQNTQKICQDECGNFALISWYLAWKTNKESWETWPNDWGAGGKVYHWVIRPVSGGAGVINKIRDFNARPLSSPVCCPAEVGYYLSHRRVGGCQPREPMLDRKLGCSTIARVTLISCHWSSGGRGGVQWELSGFPEGFQWFVWSQLSTSFTFFILASPGRPRQPRHTSSPVSSVTFPVGMEIIPTVRPAWAAKAGPGQSLLFRAGLSQLKTPLGSDLEVWCVKLTECCLEWEYTESSSGLSSVIKLPNPQPDCNWRSLCQSETPTVLLNLNCFNTRDGVCA